MRNPSVRFAGYRMPHPLVFDCHIKVEVMDRNKTPIQIVQKALEELKTETEILESQFSDAVSEYERFH